MKIPRLDDLMQHYPQLEACREDLQNAFVLCERCFAGGHRLLICGNGGSAADAEHIVGELMKGYLKRRPVPQQFRDALQQRHPSHAAYLADHLQGALPAMALTGHPALSTAFSNDVAPDMVFAQQLYGYGTAGDLLLAISTSGNSANVVNAVRVADAREIASIGLTGTTGGTLARICSVTIRVPGQSTPRIQELHLPVYHWLCEALEERFF